MCTDSAKIRTTTSKHWRTNIPLESRESIADFAIKLQKVDPKPFLYNTYSSAHPDPSERDPTGRYGRSESLI